MFPKVFRVVAVSTLVLLSAAVAQEKREKKAAPKPKPVEELGILVEYIEVDHRVANKLVRDHAKQAHDAAELRKKLDDLIDDGEALLVETAWLRTRSGQRGKTESIREEIYPTEYDPAEIPNTPGGVVTPTPPVKDDSDKRERGKGNAPPPQVVPRSDRPLSGLMTSANPTAFETRNIGTTLEVDAVVSDDGETIDLNLAPELVTLLGNRYFTREGFEETAYGVDHIRMPLFYAIKTTTQVRVRPGKVNLLGLHKPHGDGDRRILVILQVDLIGG